MHWVVGIDEAGYGPNLGPLVQAAVALRLPDDDPAGWNTLKSVVRRCKEKADGRLLIDDSKKVYTRGGLAALERNLWPITAADRSSVGELLWGQEELPKWGEDLNAETWFDSGDLVPVEVDPASLWEKFENARTALGERWYADFRIVPTPRFNQIVDEFQSKAVVLSRGLIELAAGMYATIPSTESIRFLCDKHGGRNFYAGIIQEAFPAGYVIAEKESAEESRYRVELLARRIVISFRPRADGDSVAVALASMWCKYLREVCMRQFNRFWAEHVPGIKPTAGYPVDAKRFFAEIQTAMNSLKMTNDQVWRKR